MIKRIISIVKRLFVPINWYKTILFNFKMLPLKQAMRLPIFIYGNAQIKESTGRIVLYTDKIHMGGIVFGRARAFGDFPRRPIRTYIEVCGVLELGEHASFGNECVIQVNSTGKLHIGSDVVVGGNCHIYCDKSIHIGEHTMISWDCQFFDTNFHYLMTADGLMRKKWEAVYIGDRCWIGNRVTVNKGSYISDGTIVASNSLVNKNFRGTYGAILAGIPARVLSENNKHVWNVEGTERYVNDWFITHPDSDIYSGIGIQLFE